MNQTDYQSHLKNKPGWVRPELRRIEAGSAESNFTGNQVDASDPQRS